MSIVQILYRLLFCNFRTFREIIKRTATGNAALWGLLRLGNGFLLISPGVQRDLGHPARNFVLILRM